MWNKLIFAFLFFRICTVCISQEIKISGFITDSINSEPLIGVSIFCPQFNISTKTNDNGYFSILIPKTDSLAFLWTQMYGYKKKIVTFLPANDQQISIELNSTLFQAIDEVEIIAQRRQNQDIGVIDIPISQLKKIPMLGGEPDVIKAFQLMPGVAGGTEGTSGLYVRGGSPDQNLFLLDNVPLYYVSHIGGFISTFDPAMINSVKLYKSNFPGQYSGRLSSIIDVRMRDGNRNKRSGEVAVGLLSTKLQFDGPMKKDSSWTYLISARRFNLDIITRLLARLDSQGESAAGYTFYDANLKLVKRFKNKSKLSFTYYDGRDRIFVKARRRQNEQNSNAYKYNQNIIWGNRLGSVNYSTALGKRIFAAFNLGTTNFRYITKIESKFSDNGSNELTNSSLLKFQSKVNDVLLKTKFDLKWTEKYKMTFGWNGTFHLFTPGTILRTNNNQQDTSVVTKIHAYENNFFLENHVQVSKRISATVGLNSSLFALKDTTFFSLEPRFFTKMQINENLSFQMGYARMKQYIHYLSYSGAGLPSDLWLPATKDLIPEISNQFNAGFIFISSSKKVPLKFSLEGFYKTMNHLLEYKEGVSLFSANTISSKIEKSGVGRVIGLEFLVEKSIGKTTGWIGYTLSKNTRTFENINGGKTYAFKFDRRHDISISIAHQISKKIQLNATWVFASGNAITLAQSNYYQIDLGNYYPNNNDPYQLNIAEQYNGKNGFRMPAYHKLDIGININKVKQKGIRTWSFGLYNAYNRQNPFFLFYKKNSANEVKLNQLTLFPIIPSFHYSFVFK